MNMWILGRFCRKQVEETSSSSPHFQDEKMNIGRGGICLVSHSNCAKDRIQFSFLKYSSIL